MLLNDLQGWPWILPDRGVHGSQVVILLDLVNALLHQLVLNADSLLFSWLIMMSDDVLQDALRIGFIDNVDYPKLTQKVEVAGIASLVLWLHNDAVHSAVFDLMLDNLRLLLTHQLVDHQWADDAHFWLEGLSNALRRIFHLHKMLLVTDLDLGSHTHTVE